MTNFFDHFSRNLRDISTSSYLRDAALCGPLTDVIGPRFERDVLAIEERLRRNEIQTTQLKGLRVAITNVDMGALAGSQLWSLDVAKYLLGHGVEAVVYANVLGRVAALAEEAGVRVTDSPSEVERFSPNVLQIHHAEAAKTLLHRAKLAAPRINLIHGLLPWAGMPGLSGMQRYAAVSVASRAKVHALTGVAWEDIRQVPTFFDPGRFFVGSSTEPNGRALLFSSRTPDAQKDALREQLARHGIALDHIGQGGPMTSRPEDRLGDYRLVFAVGRSAVEAAASGAQVVLWDDGIVGPAVTTENFWKCVASNFALAANMLSWVEVNAPTAGTWLEEQLSYSVMRPDVTTLVHSYLTLDKIAPLLTDLYLETVDERPHEPTPADRPPPPQSAQDDSRMLLPKDYFTSGPITADEFDQILLEGGIERFSFSLVSGRSGSTLLGDICAACGLGSGGEPFKESTLLAWQTIAEPDDFKGYLADVVSTHALGNVLHFQITPQRLAALMSLIPKAVFERGRVSLVLRRNLIAQGISYFNAARTGLWHSNRPQLPPETTLSENEDTELARCLLWALEGEEQCYGLLDVPMQEFFYEDIVASTLETAYRYLQWHDFPTIIADVAKAAASKELPTRLRRPDYEEQYEWALRVFKSADVALQLRSSQDRSHVGRRMLMDEVRSRLSPAAERKLAVSETNGPADPPVSAKSLVTEELVPSPWNDRSSGILATRALAEAGIAGIGQQFTADAAVYADRYNFGEAMLTQIGRALVVAQIERGSALRVLDIGSGSGNATFALATLLTNAEIVASDLSPQLLQIAAATRDRMGLGERISLVVANASTISLQPGSFDLICGSSMLHHLLRPKEAVAAYLTALKPSGSAMFFEPFHSGAFALRQVMVGLIHLSRHMGPLCLDPKVVKLLKDFVFGIDFVTDDARDPDTKADLDDKWLFSKNLFAEAATLANRPLSIYATSPGDEPFRQKLENMLRSMGQEVRWPSWALHYLQDADGGRTVGLRQDLLTEGAIIFGPESAG